MNNDDLVFLQRRERMARSWRTAGALALLLLAALLAWLFIKSPVLVNPVFVAGRLEAGTIERGTVEIMAAMLPMAILGCFVTTTVMVGFGFTVFSIERRYLGIIRELRQAQVSLPEVDGGI